MAKFTTQGILRDSKWDDPAVACCSRPDQTEYMHLLQCPRVDAVLIITEQHAKMIGFGKDEPWNWDGNNNDDPEDYYYSQTLIAPPDSVEYFVDYPEQISEKITWQASPTTNTYNAETGTLTMGHPIKRTHVSYNVNGDVIFNSTDNINHPANGVEVIYSDLELEEHALSRAPVEETFVEGFNPLPRSEWQNRIYRNFYKKTCEYMFICSHLVKGCHYTLSFNERERPYSNLDWHLVNSSKTEFVATEPTHLIGGELKPDVSLEEFTDAWNSSGYGWYNYVKDFITPTTSLRSERGKVIEIENLELYMTTNTGGPAPSETQSPE